MVSLAVFHTYLHIAKGLTTIAKLRLHCRWPIMCFFPLPSSPYADALYKR